MIVKVTKSKPFQITCLEMGLLYKGLLFEIHTMNNPVEPLLVLFEP